MAEKRTKIKTAPSEKAEETVILRKKIKTEIQLAAASFLEIK